MFGFGEKLRKPEPPASGAGAHGIIRRTEAFLPELSGPDAGELVEGVIGRLANLVGDLPASERHHHGRPWGLFEHSTETGELALRAAGSELFRDETSGDPEEDFLRLPRLRYAIWLWGLGHDLGKVLTVHVRVGRHRWNPLAEELSSFYQRRGREGARIEWMAGRGLHGDEAYSPFVLGRMLPQEAYRYLGAALVREVLFDDTIAARRVRALIDQADRASSGGTQSLPAVLQKTAPVEPPKPVAAAEPEAGKPKPLTPDGLFEDLRLGVVGKWFPINEPKGAVYVTPEITYLASPRVFERLYAKDLYTPNPQRELSLYLEPLGRHPAVRTVPNGRVLHRIAIRPGGLPEP